MRAEIAATTEQKRQKFLARLRSRGSAQPLALEQQILAAIESVRAKGFCAASWQPEVVALASPLELPHSAFYVVNMSVTTTEVMEPYVSELRLPLLDLRNAIRNALIQQMEI